MIKQYFTSILSKKSIKQLKSNNLHNQFSVNQHNNYQINMTIKIINNFSKFNDDNQIDNDENDRKGKSGFSNNFGNQRMRSNNNGVYSKNYDNSVNSNNQNNNRTSNYRNNNQNNNNNNNNRNNYNKGNNNYNNYNDNYNNKNNNYNNNNYNNYNTKTNNSNSGQPNSFSAYQHFHHRMKATPISNKSYGNLQSQYWQHTLTLIQPAARSVITCLLTPELSKKTVLRQVQIYLQFRSMTFQPQIRSDLGVLSLLVAINQSPHEINLEQYQSRIIDFITLSDHQLPSLIDSEMLHYFIINLNKRMNTNVQKNIRQYYRMKYVQILKTYFDKIYQKDYLLIISHLLETINKDHYNYITRWRIFPLFQKIQHKFVGFVKEEVQRYEKKNKQNQGSSNHDLQVIKNVNKISQHAPIILTMESLEKFIQLIGYYEYTNQQLPQLLIKYLTNTQIINLQDHNQFRVFMKAINKLPYYQIPTQEQVNKNNPSLSSPLQKQNPCPAPIKLLKSLKSILLTHLQQQFNTSSFVRSTYSSSNYYIKRYNIQILFQQQFYFAYLSLKFHTIKKNNNHYQILHEQNLIKPFISQFVWRLIKQDQKNIEKVYIK